MFFVINQKRVKSLIQINFSLFFNLNLNFSFKWQVYLKCRAGGIGPSQHLAGDIREFNFFLRFESGQIDLDRRYSWIKCNNEFRGYYVMDYSAQLLLAFDEILSTNKDVSQNLYIFLYFKILLFSQS